MDDPKSILVSTYRDPLRGRSKKEYFDHLRQSLKGRALEAYIFGSLAKNERPHDIDLILVVDTKLPFLKRAEEFFDLYDNVGALDLLIYTPAEFANLKADCTVGFWRDVLATMEKVL